MLFILFLSSCSPKGYVYRVHPLEGANYPKGTVKPKTVSSVVLVSFILLSPAIWMYESKRDN